jgi:S1-C subfamily serine protease
MTRRHVSTLCGLLVFGAVAPVHGQAFSRSLQQIVDAATLTVVPGTCAGVVVGDESHAITAAHCIGAERRLTVRFHDGRVTSATVAALDRERDVALLELTDPAGVNPLRIATQLPRIGEALYFGGRQDRQGSAQVFAVLQLGRCPSLPQVENAIFTNLRARKGDSGAPLVNKSLEVVGLVHGGARCNIATPIIGFEPRGSQRSAVPSGAGS